MTLPLLRPAVLAAQLGAPVESWTDLDAAVLLKTRRRKDCMTCHRFRASLRSERHRSAHPPAAPGLIVHGEPLTSRPQGWSIDMTRLRG